jgi:hypothetical protein
MDTDRKFMPDLFQTAFNVSVGAAYKSFEMMLNPMESANRMIAEARDIISFASEAGDGIQEKAGALAGAWMDRSLSIVEDCRSAGARIAEAMKAEGE